MSATLIGQIFCFISLVSYWTFKQGENKRPVYAWWHIDRYVDCTIHIKPSGFCLLGDDTLTFRSREISIMRCFTLEFTDLPSKLYDDLNTQSRSSSFLEAIYWPVSLCNSCPKKYHLFEILECLGCLYSAVSDWYPCFPCFLQVLFETDIMHKLFDCKVTQEISPYNNKTAQKIANEPQHNAIKESFQQILREEQELPWLHRCVRAGVVDAARILMERHPDQLQMKDSQGGSPLYWAIMGGCSELVQMILNSTPTDDVLDIGRMKPGGTALCLAASVCRADLIPILVQYGADPDVTGSGNKTPLEYAIKEKDPKTIRALFDAGASLPTDALCQSVITGHLGTFEAVLNEETNVDKQVCKPFDLVLLLLNINCFRGADLYIDDNCTTKAQELSWWQFFVAAEGTQGCHFDNIRCPR